MKKIGLFFLFLFLFSSFSFAQYQRKAQHHKSAARGSGITYKRIYPDSAWAAFCFSLQGGLQTPTGNLYNRFGYTKSVGLSFFYKSKSSICIGLAGDYFFGNTIKEQNLFANISTPDGKIITDGGDYAEVRLYERGFFIGPTWGYVSHLLSKNRNSGLSFWLNAGYFQHQIKILGDNVSQLQPDYKVGYDRLTSGFAVQPGIFYFHMSRTHLVNYRIGVEFLCGFTQGQRTINFDTGLSGKDKRFDGMLGIKAAWFLPKFFNTVKQDFTY